MLKRFTSQMSLAVVTLALAACNAATPAPATAGVVQPTAQTQATQPVAQATTDTAQPTAETVNTPVGLVAKLNLNTATADELLATIPGFGNRMVREFMEYRPYTSIEQFRREIGKYVDAAQIAEYEKYVYVPIDINEADVATLQQIPGLDATEAEALVAARPFARSADFLAKLQGYVGATELAQAQTYLSAP